jgi:hypothetical protein
MGAETPRQETDRAIYHEVSETRARRCTEGQGDKSDERTDTDKIDCTRDVNSPQVQRKYTRLGNDRAEYSMSLNSSLSCLKRGLCKDI